MPTPHQTCKPRALKLLEQISYRLHQLENMAQDGCTLARHTGRLAAIKAQVDALRRAVLMPEPIEQYYPPETSAVIPKALFGQLFEALYTRAVQFDI